MSNYTMSPHRFPYLSSAEGRGTEITAERAETAGRDEEKRLSW